MSCGQLVQVAVDRPERVAGDLVGERDDAAGARDLGHHGEVDKLEQRIARRLDPDDPRLGPDRRLERGAVAHVGGGVGGGVKGGIYSLAQRTTVLQLLCQIEDARKADLKRAYLQRDGKRIKTDFSKLFIQGDTSDDIALEPNDIIFLPTNVDKNVYVMGAVNTPKFIEYREGMTVMEAILEAGGFTKFASQNDTYIYRKDDNKKESVIPVKIKRLINDGELGQNVKLRPGDYIVVKESIF